MAIPASLRLGCVKYLNALPLIHGWGGGPVRFDHPSILCRALAEGQLDAAFVSSFEYLRNPVYDVVDGVAVGSDGPVYSVVLAHLEPIEELREIVLDPASATSVNLLRCLFGARSLKPEFVRAGDLGFRRGRLLIGDQALRFRAEAPPEVQFLDLGAEWQRQTRLPFVYALWLIRPEYRHKAEVAEALRSLGQKNRRDLDSFIASRPEAERPFCYFYFRDCLRFTFGEGEKRGFREFARRCHELGLLDRLPPEPSFV